MLVWEKKEVSLVTFEAVKCVRWDATMGILYLKGWFSLRCVALVLRLAVTLFFT